MRTIKFRAFDDGKMVYQTNALQDLSRFFRVIRKDAIIMQYTGINDKNGVEIYEGDIVRINKEHQSFGGENLHKVEYVSQSAKFHLIGTYFDNMSEGIIDINGKNCCEVIGNIFDNPELLK